MYVVLKETVPDRFFEISASKNERSLVKHLWRNLISLKIGYADFNSLNLILYERFLVTHLLLKL